MNEGTACCGAENRHAILAVLPARFASTRFPGKMLTPIAGKPLIWHTYMRTCQATLVTDVIVATDDVRIREALEPFGAKVMMTRDDHSSGTDRIAEVASASDADIIVNVQGDEALIDPHTIDDTIRPLLDDPTVPMATARRLISDPTEVADPSIVKVVCDRRGRALYFSRWPIPAIRDADHLGREGGTPPCHWQHIGIYVFRRDFLMQYAAWEPTPLEGLEKLEQLRVLEHGHAIAVVDTEYQSIGVDTPEDVARVEAILGGDYIYG